MRAPKAAVAGEHLLHAIFGFFHFRGLLVGATARDGRAWALSHFENRP
jgi:hypothetical protein